MDKVIKYTTSLLVIFFPFRYTVNGIMNLLGIEFPVYFGFLFLFLSIGAFYPFSYSRRTPYFLLLFLPFLILLFFHEFSGHILVDLATGLILLPFLFLIVDREITVKSFNSILRIILVSTVSLAIVRIVIFIQDYKLFNLLETRMLFSLVRSPSEILSSGSLGADSIIQARYLGLLFVSVLFSKMKKSYIVIGLLLFLLFLIILTGNRQSLLAILFVVFVMTSRINKVKLLVLSFLIAVVLYLSQDLQLFGRLFTEGGGERTAFWSWIVFSRQSYSLFGNGSNSFGVHYGVLDQYPHNIWLEVLYNYGLLALVFLLAIFSISIIDKFREMDFYSKWKRVVILYYLIVTFFSGNIELNIIFLSFIIYAGISPKKAYS